MEKEKAESNRDILSISNSILLSGVIVAVSIFISGGVAPASGTQAASAQSGTVAEQKAEISPRNGEAKEGRGKVVVYEFSDFQCPYCQQFWSTTYSQIKKDYIDTNKITFIYRQFPINSIHPFAQKAAEAAECANDQGRFFEYHDALFSNGKADGAGLDIASLKKYAANLGLNAGSFNKCLDNSEKADVVAGDLRSGQEVGVTGTPTFFVNGKKYVGALPYAQFKQIIDEELKKS